MSNVNAAVTMALSKCIKDTAAASARKDLTVGEIEIDTVVRIKGTLKVGADYERTPTVSVPLIETMALLLHNSGFTREKSKSMLIAAMQGALSETGKGQGAIAEAYKEIIAEASKHVTDTLAALPKVTVRGAVTTKLEVEYLPAES